jgi:imidazolonepropionase-like amidohydrolase
VKISRFSANRVRDSIRLIGLIRVLLLALSLPSLLTPVLRAQQTIAVTGGTLVDPLLGTIARSMVVIRDDRIAAVGREGEVPVPKDARIIDATGQWIVPGLIDAHVHFFQSGGLYTRPDILDLRALRPYEQERTMIRASLPATLARYVANGITAVADVGGPLWTFALRDSAAVSPRAPEIAAAGPLIATWAPEQLRADDPPMLVPHSPEEARALVRSILPFHPFAIKIWYIVRRGRTATELLPIVQAAIDESHRGGVKVAVHATELETARLAVEAGADILVHSVEDHPIDDDLLALMLRRHVIYTPTILVGMRYRDLFRGGPQLDPIERERGDSDVLRTLDPIPLISEDGPRGGLILNPVAARNLCRVIAAGVPVAAGTDAGNIGTLHGPSLFVELEMMAGCGLSRMDLLQAATIGGARLMGRERELGSIAPGKVADLLILRRDPLEGPYNLASAVTVIHRGRIVR